MAPRLHRIEIGPRHWTGRPLIVDGHAAADSVKSARYSDPSFVRLFRPILPDLRRYWWLDIPLDFERASKQARFTEVWDALDAQQLVPPDTILPRFAKYIPGERGSFSGFLHNVGNAAEVRTMSLSKRGTYTPWYEQTVEIEFTNVDDDAFWILRTSDRELVDRVRQHANESPELFFRV